MFSILIQNAAIDTSCYILDEAKNRITDFILLAMPKFNAAVALKIYRTKSKFYFSYAQLYYIFTKFYSYQVGKAFQRAPEINGSEIWLNVTNLVK